MRLHFAIVAALAVTCGALEAKPFRWASQGDPQTIDPHSQNELLTNSVNGQMYETLVNRGKQLEIVPVLATEWKQVDTLTWRFTLRKGRVVRLDARERHRPVHAQAPRARREDRDGAQPQLVGKVAGERERGDIPVHQVRRDARLGADRRQRRPDPRPAAAGCAAPE